MSELAEQCATYAQEIMKLQHELTTTKTKLRECTEHANMLFALLCPTGTSYIPPAAEKFLMWKEKL